MRHHLPAFVAATVAIQVGATIVGTRLIVDQAGPASLAVVRYAVGTLCLIPIVVMARYPRFAPRDAAAIAVLGMLQFGAVVAFLNISLAYISSARAALIFATTPLITLLFAALLRHERLTWPKTLGILVTILGVGLALGEKAIGDKDGVPHWIGEAAAITSALCAAICSVLYRPYVRRYPAVPVACLAMAAAVAALVVAAAFEGFFTSAPRLTPVGWIILVFIGISSGVFYYLWVWAMSRSTATRVAIFLSLSPITAALLGAAVLGEAITPGVIAGLLAVCAGLWLAHRPTPGDHLP